MLLHGYGIFKEIYIYMYIYNFKLLGLIFHGITFHGEGENGSDE